MSTALQTFDPMATAAAAKFTIPTQEDISWAAVLNRDARLDGALYYAVKSTGVYCKPSCPSRRPRREQVSFFADPAAAEGAGFRACRRCHPRDVNGFSPQAKLVKR